MTDYSTVYTALLNFLKIAKQLKQSCLPVFCDKGVFRIVIDIYLKNPKKFESLIPMMGGFHMAKCAQRCIGNYIQGTGLEDVFVEAGVMGVKVVESFLAGTHYVRSFRGIQILSQAIEIVKWKAFWKLQDKSEFEEALEVLKESANALIKRKDHEGM